jgi:hypothetical protein
MYEGCMQTARHSGGDSAPVDWVRVGDPEVHRQRGKWVVRQGGYDPRTARRRVKQLGTFETKRAALAHRRRSSPAARG